ncbi:MAG TPA: amidohydrolase family protein [Pirellulales bacterium]|nr:amidohydrolase family protein [Pirellulales bacterium]
MTKQQRLGPIAPASNLTISRRALLQAGAAGALTTLAGAGAQADQADAISAIDAHTHFYDPTRPQGVPWPDKRNELLYRPVLPEEFKRLTRPQHIGGTVVVEASPWVEDNQWLLDLAEREPFLVGVVGRLDPADEQFPNLLRRFARQRRFRGIRISHDALNKALEQPSQQKNLALLAEHDLELDVNGGPQMSADVARAAQALPELRIVINHCANLPLDGRAPPDEWRRGMQAAAKREQVYCKVSALAEATRKPLGEAPTDLEFYRPVLDALWEMFGADRLIYGSNWPVSNRAATYADVYAIVHAYFESRGPGILKKFLRDNALAAYKPLV